MTPLCRGVLATVHNATVQQTTCSAGDDVKVQLSPPPARSSLMGASSVWTCDPPPPSPPGLPPYGQLWMCVDLRRRRHPKKNLPHGCLSQEWQQPLSFLRSLRRQGLCRHFDTCKLSDHSCATYPTVRRCPTRFVSLTHPPTHPPTHTQALPLPAATDSSGQSRPS